MSDIPDGYAEEFKKRGFVLVERVGSGSSGGVYRAIQTSLDRPVAIKVFDNIFSANDHKLRKRFEHEARMLARVRHPSLPVVLTRGEASIEGNAVPYSVLEFIEGSNLLTIIQKERSLKLARAVSYGSQVLGALAAAHAKKIVHRDVKPANIMVEPVSGHVHLIDFSIGVSLDAAPGLTRVTAEGNQPGSYDYMAPEQKEGHDVDHRADLYAFGVVLFEMLTGHPRVNLGTIDADLKPFPAELRAVVSKACHEDRTKRLETAEAFVRALQPFGTAFRAREQPADALCLNLRCAGAQWTQRGYYEGPRIVEATRANRCDECGASLHYPCEKCFEPFTGKRFCANCGNEHFQVPACATCGSWLKREDMGTETAANGCQKCRSKRGTPRSSTSGPSTSNDDDIPF